ncbi:unnamed protein product [Arabidopsis halleri]
MCSHNDHMKMHITYGGSMSLIDNKFSYSGGKLAMDYRIDPDLLTWSIFQEFMEKQGVARGVEQVWYQLPNEDISVARCIYKDKDNEIRQLCSEVTEVREVYVYTVHGVSPPIMVNVADIEAHVDDGEDEEEEEEEEEEDSELDPVGNDDARHAESEDENGNVGEEAANKRAVDPPSEDEAVILGERAVDPRFENLFTNVEEEYRDSLIDTDDEWANFHKGLADYDKPPYLWLMQTFNNGDEFKDQLLRYVLKTQYDVKLNRWESTKQAAICNEPKCQWRIYCLVEKPLPKWMVKDM